MTAYAHRHVQSPVGPITLVAHAGFLVAASCRNDQVPSVCDDASLAAGRQHGLLDAATAQLTLYFERRLKQFDLPLAPRGTPFQLQVWRELQTIPFGELLSYGEMARRLGMPQSVRAVASAIGRNPLPLFIPCQRVVGSAGHLTGFSGGLAVKRFLLELEGLEIEAGATPSKDRVSQHSLHLGTLSPIEVAIERNRVAHA